MSSEELKEGYVGGAGINAKLLYQDNFDTRGFIVHSFYSMFIL